jgi:hypothetical protein
VRQDVKRIQSESIIAATRMECFSRDSSVRKTNRKTERKSDFSQKEEKREARHAANAGQIFTLLIPEFCLASNSAFLLGLKNRIFVE